MVLLIKSKIIYCHRCFPGTFLEMFRATMSGKTVILASLPNTMTWKVCLLRLFNWVSFILIISQHSAPFTDRQSVNFYEPFSNSLPKSSNSSSSSSCCNNFHFISPSVAAACRILVLSPCITSTQVTLSGINVT